MWNGPNAPLLVSSTRHQQEIRCKILTGMMPRALNSSASPAHEDFPPLADSPSSRVLLQRLPAGRQAIGFGQMGRPRGVRQLPDMSAAAVELTHLLDSSTARRDAWAASSSGKLEAVERLAIIGISQMSTEPLKTVAALQPRACIIATRTRRAARLTSSATSAAEDDTALIRIGGMMGGSASTPTVPLAMSPWTS